MLHSAKLPLATRDRLWAECATTATHMENLVAATNKATPDYQAFFGQEVEEKVKNGDIQNGEATNTQLGRDGAMAHATADDAAFDCLLCTFSEFAFYSKSEVEEAIPKSEIEEPVKIEKKTSDKARCMVSGIPKIFYPIKSRWMCYVRVFQVLRYLIFLLLL